MNTFSYQSYYPSHSFQHDMDWLTCDWGGPYFDDDEEDYPTAVCGEASCPGNCYICMACEQMRANLFVPIQGPVNRDGVPLGFLLVTD